jgi:polyisoprenoid-binding protein YceI
MRTGFEARGQVDRKDFGLTWNKALETGGFVVGDNVEIGIEVAAVEQK